jgi:PTS system nitrogen regulatory IIA component
MILTLKELANHLRVNERTILRMQQAGQIKGVKIGGQWRFNSSQIAGLFFPERPAAGPDAVPLSDLARGPLVTPLSRILRPDRIVLDMQAADAAGAIAELCRVVKQKNLILDVRDLEARVLAREKLLSTGVGSGVALPHPRDPIPTLSELAIVIMGRSRRGIEFEAIDDKPVHLFFLFCSQTIALHLHLLGRLAHVLRRDGAIAAMNAAKTPEDVLRTVLDAEREGFFGGGNEDSPTA